jgi:membrane associated rhomboid family serine protease
MARYIILTGIIFLIIGIILQLFPGLLNWLGKLPGDIRYESGNTRINIPITTMLLLSILLTIAINLLRRLL